MPFFLPALGVLGAKAVGGVGLGYGLSRIGDNEEYDILGRDGGLDALLGMASIPGVGPLGKYGMTRQIGRGFSSAMPARHALALSNSASRVPGSRLLGNAMTKVGKTARKNRAKLMAAQGLGMVSIPVTAGAGRPDGKGGRTLGEVKGRKVQGPMLTPVSGGGGAATGGSLEDLFAGLPSVNPAKIYYKPGQAPTFNKKLADYLADRQLQGLVGQNIFATNVPLLEANKQEKVDRKRNVKQNRDIGESLQKEYQERIVEEAADSAAAIARQDARQQLLAAETLAAESTVPITYLEGEAAGAKESADKARATEAHLSDQLIDRLASAGDRYLKDLKGAQGSQTRAEEQLIKQRHEDNIRANAAQIRTNQAQRGSLLGTLAAQQYQNDIDLYNTAISNYNNVENRRYQHASDAATHRYNAAAQNAQNKAALLNTGMQIASDASSEKAEVDGDPKKRGHQRLVELQKALDSAHTKMVKDPKTGNMVPYASRPEGKKEIKRLRKRIATVKERYGTGPV